MSIEKKLGFLRTKLLPVELNEVIRIHTEGEDDLSRFLLPNDGNNSDPEA